MPYISMSRGRRVGMYVGPDQVAEHRSFGVFELRVHDHEVERALAGDRVADHVHRPTAGGARLGLEAPEAQHAGDARAARGRGVGDQCSPAAQARRRGRGRRARWRQADAEGESQLESSHGGVFRDHRLDRPAAGDGQASRELRAQVPGEQGGAALEDELDGVAAVPSLGHVDADRHG
jgi:hypothetical protein